MCRVKVFPRNVWPKSCISHLDQGRRKIWNPEGGATSNVMGLICTSWLERGLSSPPTLLDPLFDGPVDELYLVAYVWRKVNPYDRDSPTLVECLPLVLQVTEIDVLFCKLNQNDATDCSSDYTRFYINCSVTQNTK